MSKTFVLLVFAVTAVIGTSPIRFRQRRVHTKEYEGVSPLPIDYPTESIQLTKVEEERPPVARLFVKLTPAVPTRPEAFIVLYVHTDVVTKRMGRNTFEADIREEVTAGWKLSQLSSPLNHMFMDVRGCAWNFLISGAPTGTELRPYLTQLSEGSEGNTDSFFIKTAFKDLLEDPLTNEREFSYLWAIQPGFPSTGRNAISPNLGQDTSAAIRNAIILQVVFALKTSGDQGLHYRDPFNYLFEEELPFRFTNNLYYSYLEGKVVSDFITTRTPDTDENLKNKFLEYKIGKKSFYVDLEQSKGIWAKFAVLERLDSDDTMTLPNLHAFIQQVYPEIILPPVATFTWEKVFTFIESLCAAELTRPTAEEAEITTISS